MHRAGGDRMSDELQRELADTRRRLDEAIRALRVLGDAVRAVAGSTDYSTRGVQSVCSLAALHVDQVLLELDR